MTTDHTQPAEQAAELTAEEARALADDLGLKLYRAEDTLAFVAECCDIADREQRPITTTQVREWLKGARCGRQLLADAADRTALRDRIAGAIYERNNPGRRWADAHPDDLVCYGNDADAAMTVLPPPVSRADVLREAAERVTAHAADHFPDDYDQYADALADELRRMADEAQPGNEAERVVAYRSLGGRILRCLNHIPPEPDDDFVPVASDELPDGGICTYPECGADVLIPQSAAEARQDGAHQ